MSAYYNEIDPYVAQWLRNLIIAGHIAPGDVDERSIVDVRADDIRGYAQAHFFAGIGGWSVALRLADWDDERPVWTGSCPCQPFSAAGAGKAGDDERHLWPAWASLIRERRPRTVFGEQVEAAVGWGWLDLVFTDLEAEGYACASAVLPACGVGGAPHIRQRLWFVADAGRERCDGEPVCLQPGTARQEGAEAAGGGATGGVADAECSERGARRTERGGTRSRRQTGELAGRGDAGGLGDTAINGSGPSSWLGNASRSRSGRNGRAIPKSDTGGRWKDAVRGSSVSGFWSDAEWLPCSDGKARPVEPGRETARLHAMLGDYEWNLARVKETGPTMWWIALRLSIARLHELTSDPGGSSTTARLDN